MLLILCLACGVTGYDVVVGTCLVLSYVLFLCSSYSYVFVGVCIIYSFYLCIFVIYVYLINIYSGEWWGCVVLDLIIGVWKFSVLLCW